MKQSSSELVERHTGLVKRIVKRVTTVTGFDDRNDELFQYGVTGLLEAAGRYDPTRGASFSTFAWYRIQGAIYDGLREMHPVRQSQNVDARFGASVQGIIGQAAAELETSLRDGTCDPLLEMERILSEATTIHLMSLDGMQNALADQGDAADEAAHTEELETYVKAAVARLVPIEREVIERHYYQNQAYSEIAKAIGRSKAYVCRMHRRAVQRLELRLRQLLEERDI